MTPSENAKDIRVLADRVTTLEHELVGAPLRPKRWRLRALEEVESRRKIGENDRSVASVHKQQPQIVEHPRDSSLRGDVFDDYYEPLLDVCPMRAEDAPVFDDDDRVWVCRNPGCHYKATRQERRDEHERAGGRVKCHWQHAQRQTAEAMGAALRLHRSLSHAYHKSAAKWREAAIYNSEWCCAYEERIEDLEQQLAHMTEEREQERRRAEEESEMRAMAEDGWSGASAKLRDAATENEGLRRDLATERQAREAAESDRDELRNVVNRIATLSTGGAW